MVAERPGRSAARRQALTALVCWLVVSGVAATPAARADEDAVAASLLQGRWSVQTPLGEAAGPLLLVLGPDDWWRLEIGLESDGRPLAPAQLRRRQGEGWTLTGGPDGGFYQRWHAGWRTIESPSARKLGALLRAWADGPEAPLPADLARRWRLSPPPTPATLPVPALADWFAPDDLAAGVDRLPEAPSDLRQRLTRRGLGRGGSDVVLRAHWRGHGQQLQITTVRWPGRLTLAEREVRPLLVPPEVFLPLWPLAEMLP